MPTRPDDRLWHGGIGGLNVGDLVLPPATTGNHRQANNRATLAATQPGLDMSVITPDDTTDTWVHFSPLRRVALAYAASAHHDFGHGALYVVQPEGDVDTDPDMPLQGLRARQARIVTVYDPIVRIDRIKAAKLHAAVLAGERGGSAKEQFRSMERFTDRAAVATKPGQAIMIPATDPPRW